MGSRFVREPIFLFAQGSFKQDLRYSPINWRTCVVDRFEVVDGPGFGPKSLAMGGVVPDVTVDSHGDVYLTEVP